MGGGKRLFAVALFSFVLLTHWSLGFCAGVEFTKVIDSDRSLSKLHSVDAERFFDLGGNMPSAGSAVVGKNFSPASGVGSQLGSVASGKVQGSDTMKVVGGIASDRFTDNIHRSDDSHRTDSLGSANRLLKSQVVHSNGSSVQFGANSEIEVPISVSSSKPTANREPNLPRVVPVGGIGSDTGSFSRGGTEVARLDSPRKVSTVSNSSTIVASNAAFGAEVGMNTGSAGRPGVSGNVATPIGVPLDRNVGAGAANYGGLPNSAAYRGSSTNPSEYVSGVVPLSDGSTRSARSYDPVNDWSHDVVESGGRVAVADSIPNSANFKHSAIDISHADAGSVPVDNAHPPRYYTPDTVPSSGSSVIPAGVAVGRSGSVPVDNAHPPRYYTPDTVPSSGSSVIPAGVVGAGALHTDSFRDDVNAIDAYAGGGYYVRYVIGRNETISDIAKVFHTTRGNFLRSSRYYRSSDFVEGASIIVPVKHFENAEVGFNNDKIARVFNLSSDELYDFNQGFRAGSSGNVVLLPILDSRRAVILEHRIAVQMGANNFGSTYNRASDKGDSEVNRGDTCDTCGSFADLTDENSFYLPAPKRKPDDIDLDMEAIKDGAILPSPVSKYSYNMNNIEDAPVVSSDDIRSDQHQLGANNIGHNTSDVSAIPVLLPVKRPTNLSSGSGTNRIRMPVRKYHAFEGDPVSNNVTKDIPPKSSDVELREKGFVWPVNGDILTDFRSDESGKSDGIEIAASVGSDVKAVADGVVSYVGDDIVAYSRLVIIQHPNRIISIYGYNDATMVRKGDTVSQGQVIAKVRATSDGAPSKSYFAMRHGRKVINPLSYLSSGD